MPYKHRIYEPGSAWHMTSRGVDRAPIFFEDFDRLAFLALLEKVTKLVGWCVVAWCLMETHYHLLLFAGREPQVSLGLQMLNSQYARELNRRYDRRGHLFGERYRPTPIVTDEHLVGAIAYTLRNPVRAGLVDRVEDWSWSGTTRLEPRRIGTLSAHSRDVLVRPRG
ncbi:MAG: transposase [Actinobacteria bacterium]|nr:transposase [Actinomycetota bacterium]